MVIAGAAIPDGLEEALTLIRAAMNEAAKRRVAPNVAVWALVVEAVGRLTEIHGAGATADFLASLQAELRRHSACSDASLPRVN
jgi:hypothetical protein